MGQKKSVPEDSNNNQNDSSFSHLSSITGCSIQEIAKLHESFLKYAQNNNVIEKSDFNKLYCELRHEYPTSLVKIIDYIFDAFDADSNGAIDFEEFAVISFSFRS